MPKYNLITETGNVVYNNLTLTEALLCQAKLITFDMIDKVYKQGFYKIVEAN